MDGNFTFGLEPASINSDLFSYFVQDEITLDEDRWYLYVGSKFEHNEFTGFEVQPSVRLLHLPSDRESLWFAVSRAVRTASPVEQHSVIRSVADPITPVFVEIRGDDSVESEDLLAFEMGYRAAPTDYFSWDVAGFYNHYENLIGVVGGGAPFFDIGLGAVVVPLEFANAHSADTFGVELTSTYHVNPKWELTGAYSLLYMDVHAPVSDLTQGSSPHNQLYVHSSWTPRCDWELDVIGRYVDNLPTRGISSYFVMDVRLAWRPNKHFEWSIVGRNLLDGRHAEFTDLDSQAFHTEVESEIYTMFTWTY
jgi:iron complex outermembrane receptor protein